MQMYKYVVDMVSKNDLTFENDVIIGLLDLYIDLVMIFCKLHPEINNKPTQLCFYILETQ